MGKSYSGRRAHKRDASNNRGHAATSFVALADIQITDSTWEKLMARDGQQIERYRQAYENGEDMVRVVLRPRVDGGYNVEDGRHRVIAAKQADVGFIEALIVGGDNEDDWN